MKMIKVSDQLHEKLKELAEKRGISIHDLVEEMLSVYLGGSTTDKAIKRIVDKEILSMYEARCSRCGKNIGVGEHIRYILYEYEDGSKSRAVLCSDCSLSLNPQLWKLYIKKRELETVIRQLRAEADRLAREVSIKELALSIKNILNLAYKTQASKEDMSKAERLYMEILERLDQVAEKLRSLETTPPTPPKPKPRYTYTRARY